MEKLVNEFTVNSSIARAWSLLTDVERIAPCMPGAQLQEIEGEIYRGLVAVKLGPISTSFKGQATFVDRDDAHHRAVLRGEGRDTGGKGNADALITAQLEAVSAHVTKCVVHTDLHISGKVAQFGRGVMGDVSAKLMTQFADNLNAMLGAEAHNPLEANARLAETSPDDNGSQPDGVVRSSPSTTDLDGSDSITSSGTPKVRAVEAPEAVPIALAAVAGSALMKRGIAALSGLVLLVLLLRRLRK